MISRAYTFDSNKNINSKNISEMKRIGIITALVLFTMLSSASCKQRNEQKQEESLIVDIEQNNEKVATQKFR